MRKSLKKLVQSWLKSLARSLINKYQPQVIAVTGSFGKTSSRDAIYAALRSQLPSCRKAESSLNGEFGVPLTIIGAADPQGSAFSYISALIRGLKLILVKSSAYPKVLILEMGANKPGDIAYLLEIVKPHIAVLTGIGETHLEMFGSVEHVAREKARLIEALSEQGVAIANYDNSHSREIVAKHSGRVLTYGLAEGADLRAIQVRLELNDLPSEQTQNPGSLGGVSFDVVSGGGSFGTCYLQDVIGRAPVYSALAALSVAKALSLDLAKVLADLRENFQPTPGRMRLLKGIKRTILIDDTYNSSPQAVLLALETLANLATRGKKWVVLGDMLELGTQAEALHRQVGARLAELKLDYLITTGELAHYIGRAAEEAGMSRDQVFEFADKKSAGRFLQDRMEQGDLILLKGSRGVPHETNGTRLERIVLEVMAEPMRADELLVHWLRLP